MNSVTELLSNADEAAISWTWGAPSAPFPAGDNREMDITLRDFPTPGYKTLVDVTFVFTVSLPEQALTIGPRDFGQLWDKQRCGCDFNKCKVEKESMALFTGLLVLLGTGGASAGILTVKDTGRNSTLGPFAVAPAAFGPAIDKAGVHGLLEAARPLEACDKPMDVSSNSTILLVRRSEPWERPCPFINKVRNAEAAGAKAAVVFDYIGESLLIMSKESTEKACHSDFHSFVLLSLSLFDPPF